MLKWFNRQNRIIQIIILIIPLVNWIIEIGVRWNKFLEEPKLGYCLLAILVTFGGMILGFLDAIWCLLFKHLFCAVSKDDLKK